MAGEETTKARRPTLRLKPRLVDDSAEFEVSLYRLFRDVLLDQFLFRPATPRRDRP
jgi:hypothetical protein